MARSIFLLKYKSVKSNTSNNLVLFLQVYSGFVRVLLHIRAFCDIKPEQNPKKQPIKVILLMLIVLPYYAKRRLHRFLLLRVNDGSGMFYSQSNSNKLC